MSVRSHTYVYKAKSRSRSYCFSGVHAGPTYRTSALRRLGEAYPSFAWWLLPPSRNRHCMGRRSLLATAWNVTTTFAWETPHPATGSPRPCKFPSFVASHLRFLLRGRGGPLNTAAGGKPSPRRIDDMLVCSL